MLLLFVVLVGFTLISGMATQVLISQKHMVVNRLNREKMQTLISVAESYFPWYRDTSNIHQVARFPYNVKLYVATEFFQDPCYQGNTSFTIKTKDGRQFNNVALVALYSEDSSGSSINSTNFLDLSNHDDAVYIVSLERYRLDTQRRYCP